VRKQRQRGDIFVETGSNSTFPLPPESDDSAELWNPCQKRAFQSSLSDRLPLTMPDSVGIVKNKGKQECLQVMNTHVRFVDAYPFGLRMKT
jgi:hypothetical protein